jgi:glycosyltransferase involved in cell wall biosynthesis
MRILIAVHHFPPRYASGAELRAYRTAHQLQQLGHKVRVICVEEIEADNGQGLQYTDEIYKGLPVRRLRFNLLAAPDTFRWSYDNPWIGEHLQRYLEEWQPDLLHLISGYLMSASVIHASKAAEVPVVTTLTDYWFLCPRVTLLRSNGQICPAATPTDCARCLAEECRRFRWPAQVAPSLMDRLWHSAGGQTPKSIQAGPDVTARPRQSHQRGPLNHLAELLNLDKRIGAIIDRRQRLNQALSNIDLAICPSNFLRQRYIQAGADPERLVFCRQGLDLEIPAPSASASKISTSHLRLGYMGQLAPHKGVHVLVDAILRLADQNLELTIYGDPDKFPTYAARLRQQSAGDPRIHFAGRYQRAELAQVFSEIDVVVVPSVWYENSPNIILEAFAFDIPVVASDLGGMAELIQNNENGLLFEMGNAADLARRLERLLEEPAMIQRLRNNIKPVKSTKREVKELILLYQRVVQNKSEAL